MSCVKRYIHKKMGESGGWIMTTQSEGIKQAGEPQVACVCADVWVISLNYTWPQFARGLPFTRLNFRSHPNVKVSVPASRIPTCFTDLRVERVLKSIVPTSLLHTALNLRLALWKWWQCLMNGVKCVGEVTLISHGNKQPHRGRKF